jgi:hypothetical protein
MAMGSMVEDCAQDKPSTNADTRAVKDDFDKFQECALIMHALRYGTQERCRVGCT